MKKKLFGTDGIRRTIGTEPFTHEALPRLAYALAQWARTTYKNPRIIIGQDTRESGDWISMHIQAALIAHGCTVYDAHIAPTPVIAALIAHTQNFDCGIIISASHNPYMDNGIKIIDATHGKLTDLDEEMIEQLYNATLPSPLPHYNFGTKKMYTSALDDYSQHLQSFFPAQFLAGIRVVLDCGYGATHLLAPAIFTQFGATIITLHTDPNGKNINNQSGALHPEALQQAVVSHNAHIGFAFDGDGDRIIAVNNRGEIKDGDDILALLLTHSKYRDQHTVVGTIMSNQGFACHIQHHNKTLLRTPVGDKYITQALIQNDQLLGGEQSGHIIVRDYLKSSDGIFVGLLIAQTMIETNNWHLASFTHFPQHLINMPITQKKSLDNEPCATLIKEYEAILKNGRLVVRYSGTENVLRVMIEDENIQFAQRIGNELAQKLHTYIESENI